MRTLRNPLHPILVLALSLIAAGPTLPRGTAAAQLPTFIASFHTIPMGRGSHAVSIADMNGDGVSDLVCAFADSAAILLGDGAGGFDQTQTIVCPLTPAIGDVNGDGRLDLVIPTREPAGFRVYLGDGSGRMGVGTDYSTTAPPAWIGLADFNGDGRLDVAAAIPEANSIAIFLGTGSGSFGAGAAFAAGGSPVFLTSGDLDGDGVSDLLYSNRGASHSIIWLGNGDATFHDGGTTPGRGGVAALGDFNRDGRTDLVLAADSASVALGNGDGTFQGPVALPRSERGGVLAVAIGDLNRDGIPDLAAASPGVDYYAFPPPNLSASVYLGHGDGTFGTEIRVDTPGGPASLAIGDLNGDGSGDLAVAAVAAGLVSWHLGHGDGTFGDAPEFAVGLHPGAIAAADFDKDGDLDVATANHDGASATVLLGRGDGRLGTRRDVTFAEEPAWLVARDMNGDGCPDLVAAAGQWPDATVEALLGGCDGSLLPQPQAALQPTPMEIDVADFDGDGAQDAVIATDRSILLCIGKGDGSFDAPRIVDDLAGGSAGTIWAGDLNRDGMPDIAYGEYVAYPKAILVCVRLGHGDGTFGDRAENPIRQPANHLTGGRIDGDDWPDLVAVGYHLGVTLLGNGDGTFRAGTTFSAPDTPVHASLGDLNGDGATDLVTASPFSNVVSIGCGRGDGSFDPMVSFGAGEGPVAMALGDFDRDGRTDIAVVDGRGSTVSLLLNRTPGAGPLPAHASLEGNGVIVAGAGRPEVCVGVVSPTGAFARDDVEATSLTWSASGTGSVASISGSMADAAPGAPKPAGRGAADITVCFRREDVARLFDKLSRKSTLLTTLGGTLKDGRTFAAPLAVVVVPAGGPMHAVVSPNPANPSSVLSLTTSAAGAIRVDLFDVRGRLVCTVAEERRAPAGDHAYLVDGRNRSGGLVASGVYFARIRTDHDGEDMVRLMILK